LWRQPGAPIYERRTSRGGFAATTPIIEAPGIFASIPEGLMLETLLAQGRPLLADGATGTNLFAMGLSSGDNPELWNVLHPDRVLTLHQAFVDAGADIILTNSFGANHRRLTLHQLAGRTRELNRVAAEIGRLAADRAGRPVVVAGSVGPTGDLMAPLGPLAADEAVDVFVEQIEGLKEGGADVIWIETMSAPDEIRAAARAAGALAMPYTTTASFGTAGKTMMGLAPAEFAALTATFDPRPLAFGANCGVGAADLVMSVLDMTQARPEAVVIAKANAGIPHLHGTHVHYSGTPEMMAEYAGLAIDAGARIVGGCCGSTAAHVAAMRLAIDRHAAGARPQLAEIVAALGALVAPPSTAQGRPRPRRRGSTAP
jgi:5-methyltetrahydrofolate--homocysteine methyltransferase